MSDETPLLASRRLALSPLLGTHDFPPLSSRVQVEFGARSERGRRQATNTDHHLVVRLSRHQETLLTSLPGTDVPLPFDESGYGMVVADGVGDTEAGEAASRLAISTLVHLALRFGKWNLRINDAIAHEVMARAERFYRQVDSALAERGRTEAAPGLQTTLTATFSAGNECFFAHVGNSRGYLFRDGELMQLTHDHTMGSERPHRAGTVAAFAPDLEDVLTDAIGGGQSGSLRVDVERFRLLDRDTLLLCTDGLSDRVSGESIEAALARGGRPDEQCQRLKDLALEAGGQDDVTVVIAHYAIPD